MRAAVRVLGYSEHDEHTLFDDVRRKQALLRLAQVDMADALVAAVLAYTKEIPNIYVPLNMACRSPGLHWDKVLDGYRDYLYHLDRSIQALPNFSGPAYRGIAETSLGASYRVGCTITWQQFSSASKVVRQAFNFLIKDGNKLSGCLFVLQVLTGKEVELCSEFPHEREVLLPLNSHFQVVEHVAQHQHARKLEVIPFLDDFDASGLQLYLLNQL